MNKIKNLLNKILDAPVGQVETILGEALNCNIKLQVIEQNKNSTIREYQIIHNEIVWFTIIEEIRLDSLGSNNNR